jgi:ADP-heptose:LPS heptosyltransferase
LYSLQKDKRPRAYNNFAVNLSEGFEDMNIIDLSDRMNDLEDTVSILKNLDLVITVDTSILHLAGTLGIRTLGLIPYNPDPRWGTEEKTIWYKSVTLLRQDNYKVWEDVFVKIKNFIK